MRRPSFVGQIGGWSYLVAAIALAAAVVVGGVAAIGAWRASAHRTYWALAAAASLFYGFASLAVWRQDDPPDEKKIPVWPWRVHKWSFNAAGAFAGWAAAHLLYTQLRRGEAFDGSTFVLALVALLGVAGWVPATITGFAIALRLLAEKAVNLVAK